VKGMERAYWFLRLIADQPDLSLTEIQCGYWSRAIVVGYGTIWQLFATRKISSKDHQTGFHRSKPNKSATVRRRGRGLGDEQAAAGTPTRRVVARRLW
jgi:hypothetical protein